MEWESFKSIQGGFAEGFKSITEMVSNVAGAHQVVSGLIDLQTIASLGKNLEMLVGQQDLRIVWIYQFQAIEH